MPTVFVYMTTISDSNPGRNYRDIDYASDKRTALGAVLLCQKADVVYEKWQSCRVVGEGAYWSRGANPSRNA
jgi:hypothetical protein